MKKFNIFAFIVLSLVSTLTSCQKAKSPIRAKLSEDEKISIKYQGSPSKGETIEEKTFSIKIEGGIFNLTEENKDAKAMFLPTVEGLNYSYSTKYAENEINFSISGTPEAWSEDKIDIIIPKDLIKADEDRTNEEDLTLELGQYDITFTDVSSYFITANSKINYVGNLGEKDVNSTLKIKLSNASFNSIKENEDVKTWFDVIDENLSYTLLKNENSSSEASVKVEGRPSGDLSRTFNITIPKAYVKADESFSLPVEDMKVPLGTYNIVTQNVFAEIVKPDEAIIEFDGDALELAELNKTIKIKLTNGTFKSISGDLDCKSWMSKTIEGLGYSFSAIEGAKEGTLNITKYPYLESGEDFSITIPSKFINASKGKSISEEGLKVYEEASYNITNLTELKLRPTERSTITISFMDMKDSSDNDYKARFVFDGAYFKGDENSEFDFIGTFERNKEQPISYSCEITSYTLSTVVLKLNISPNYDHIDFYNGYLEALVKKENIIPLIGYRYSDAMLKEGARVNVADINVKLK